MESHQFEPAHHSTGDGLGVDGNVFLSVVANIIFLTSLFNENKKAILRAQELENEIFSLDARLKKENNDRESESQQYIEFGKYLEKAIFEQYMLQLQAILNQVKIIISEIYNKYDEFIEKRKDISDLNTDISNKIDIIQKLIGGAKFDAIDSELDIKAASLLMEINFMVVTEEPLQKSSLFLKNFDNKQKLDLDGFDDFEEKDNDSKNTPKP